MIRQVVLLMLVLTSAILLCRPAQAQVAFNLMASVSGNQVTLSWDYGTPNPYTFLCLVVVNNSPETTCGLLNGDSRENTEYQRDGSYVFRLEAQTADGTVLTASNSASVVVDVVDPTDVPLATATVWAGTPIPTVVLQLSDIISTTGQVARDQGAAWSLGAPLSPLLFGLTGFVAVLALLLYIVRRFRP